MSETSRTQAEGLQFLTNYRSAFTTRPDGSSWPKFEQTWHNAARYFCGLLRTGSPNTVTDIAEKMNTDQERLERFVRESPWGHENVESELREAVVMLAHAFVVRRRLETGEDRTDFSSFEEVINHIVHESAIQGLMDDKGRDRARAEELAEYMLQGYSPW